MINKRRTSKGTIRYQVRVGNRTIGTFDTLREARKAESKHHLSHVREDAMTVEQLCTRYLDLWSAGKVGKKKPKPQTVARRVPQVDHLKEFFAGRKIDTIKATEAEDFCAKHPSTVVAANSIFNYAVSRKLCATNEFAPFVPDQGEGRKNLDPLTDSQIVDLQRVVEKLFGVRMGAMVPFWAYSGLRSTEIYNLDWPDVDWDENEIVVRDGKTGPRRATLLEPAREAIESFRGIAGPVFTTPVQGKRFHNNNMSRTYTPHVRKHFNPGHPFDWYELRHFNGHLLYVRMNRPATEVAVHMGNSPQMVEDVYGHWRRKSLDGLKGAVVPRDLDEPRAKLSHVAENTA